MLDTQQGTLLAVHKDSTLLVQVYSSFRPLDRKLQ